SGKRVLVTGASRGLGLGVARGFAAAGAELTILATGEHVKRTAETLSEASGRPVGALVCDITDRAAVAREVGGLGPLDVLVNNAGLELITPILEPGEAVEETFRRIIEINVIGTYYVTREVVKTMAPGGRIVITASVWGRTSAPHFSAYSASKHANIGFMRAMAEELGPRGIAVNAVCPGWVRTDASMRSLAEIARREGRDEQVCLDEIMATQAFGGLMEPDDVASTFLFLASDQAANITGQTLNVDRGELMA
ncbi:MAG: SDR family NAD(P)-dependent oxidoreductase, partial [Alphaproteobacteria bacterium]|nr:SDR family NAD(P)-dependent oxidoreductase [Alphaproteobacteria bacterium]